MSLFVDKTRHLNRTKWNKKITRKLLYFRGGGLDVFVWVFLKGHALIHSRKWKGHDFFRKKILKYPGPPPPPPHPRNKKRTSPIITGMTRQTTIVLLSAFNLAYENTRFSSLFAAGDVLRGGTSATQQQTFHTDDANQCLHNKSCSYGVPHINLSNFTCLLVEFGKVFCSSANKLQRNSNASSREGYIPQILTVLLEIHRVYI